MSEASSNPPSRRPFPAVELAIAAFCAWRSADLLHAWHQSPYDRLGWLALLLWCLPALPGLTGPRWARPGPEPLAYLPWVAVALAMLGVVTSLNFLTYWALACAVVSLHRTGRHDLVWLGLAIGWMPVLGWVGTRFPPLAITVTRLAISVGAAVLVVYLRKRAD